MHAYDIANSFFMSLRSYSRTAFKVNFDIFKSIEERLLDAIYV